MESNVKVQKFLYKQWAPKKLLQAKNLPPPFTFLMVRPLIIKVQIYR